MEAIVSVLGFEVIPIINSFPEVGPRMIAMKSWDSVLVKKF
jgi:hypothetical protein